MERKYTRELVQVGPNKGILIVAVVIFMGTCSDPLFVHSNFSEWLIYTTNELLPAKSKECLKR